MASAFLNHTCVQRAKEMLLRKEVIQPHLPVRLPCYDFVPIADPTFDGSLPQGVKPPASGVTDFHDVTGGVYKAGNVFTAAFADLRLLATPTSRGRVADPDPELRPALRDSLHLTVSQPSVLAIVACVKPWT